MSSFWISTLAGTASRFCRNLTVVGACFVVAIPAFAQGGPPLVTDDPDTPGDGHWEINLGGIASRSRSRWDVDAPDADINYGWGDNIQLKIDAPWTFADDSDGHRQSGLGMVSAGVKWRFLDADEHGFALSTYPQYVSAWSQSSKNKGVASANAEFFLPLEMSTSAGGFEFATEVGRNFVEREADQWEAGVVIAHGCMTAALECLVEVHQTWQTKDSQTLLNLGLRWKLSDSLVLMTAAGRDFGPKTENHQQCLIYLGLQILR
jgi:hypothetical protein